MQKLFKVALVSIALTAGAPSVASASQADTMIAAAIGGAAGALIGSSMGHDRDRYDDGYTVRHVYVTREQPIERVVYVRPGYRQSVYYYDDAPRYYNHRHHHGRFHDDDDD